MLIDINKNPSHREIRQTGAFFLGGFLLIALWFFIYRDAGVARMIVLASLLPGLWMIVLPGYARPVYLAWMYFGYAMGRFMSPFFLGIVYFGIFTPMALIFRLIGRDALRLRRGATRQESYWVAHSSLRAPEFLERQS